MMFAAIILRPWAEMMEAQGMLPYLYVDNMLLVGKWEDHYTRFLAALDATHQYLKDAGAKISPEKSANFTTCSIAKRKLTDRVWHGVGAEVPILDQFRYLGAQIAMPTAQGNNLSLIHI